MGIHLSRVKFSTTLSIIFIIFIIFISNFASYTPFLEPPIEEKSELEKSIEAVQAMIESQQKKLNSPILQYFQDSYSVPSIQNEQPSALETSMECLRESELQS